MRIDVQDTFGDRAERLRYDGSLPCSLFLLAVPSVVALGGRLDSTQDIFQTLVLDILRFRLLFLGTLGLDWLLVRKTRPLDFLAQSIVEELVDLVFRSMFPLALLRFRGGLLRLLSLDFDGYCYRRFRARFGRLLRLQGEFIVSLYILPLFCILLQEVQVEVTSEEFAIEGPRESGFMRDQRTSNLFLSKNKDMGG